MRSTMNLSSNMVQLRSPCYLLLLVFFLSLLPSSLTTLSAATRREGEALVKFKNSLAPSSFLDSWSLTNLENLFNWTGITCNSAGSVSEINLSEKQLHGTLSKFGFDAFPSLNSFIIKGNKFYGPIPPAIENLTRLQYLDLSHNHLTGSIPFQVSHIESLESLYLSHNQLRAADWSNFIPMPFLSILILSSNHIESKFPEFISNSPRLAILDLAFNKFTGDLVPESTFTKLHNLQALVLNDNFFGGPFPPNLCKLSKLRVLSLSTNNFSGSIPADIGLLSNLESLNLVDNSFEGPFPTNIFKLSKLKSLGLSKHKTISGTSIPPGLGLLTNLTELDLNGNNFTGYVPDIGNLKLLKYLDLSFNQLTGPFLKTISNLTNLLFLGLNDNRFSGNIPSDFWKNSKSLRTIYLSNNDLSGNIPKEFSVHSVLEYINLGGNNFTGELPATICNLTSLSFLILSNNGLGGALPRCLGNLTDKMLSVNLANNQFRGHIPTFTKMCRLEYLNMDNNYFEGPLPQSLANCKHLKILDIGNNIIRSTFPSWLFSLGELEVLVLRSNGLYGTVSGRSTAHPFPKLRIVDLSNNQFTGYLPIQYFENMKPIDNHYLFYKNTKTQFYYYQASVSLNVKGREYEVKKILHIYTAIDLSCNKFEGEVPQVTGELRWLALLNLSHNSLTGPIPSLLGNMEALQSLDLSSNQLSRAIPHELIKLTFLEVLNLSENHLSGEIPQKGQFSTFNNDSYLGNSALCGLPLMKKCTQAVSPPQEAGNGDEDDADDNLNWEAILMGYGCGLICGLSSGYIVFKIGKPWWFVRYIEVLQLKLMMRNTKKTVKSRPAT